MIVTRGVSVTNASIVPERSAREQTTLHFASVSRNRYNPMVNTCDSESHSGPAAQSKLSRRSQAPDSHYITFVALHRANQLSIQPCHRK